MKLPLIFESGNYQLISMSLYYKFFLILAVVLVTGNAYAQIPYIDSKELLTKGYEQHKDGHYKKALEYYRQVSEADTNYASAVYEQVLSLQADSSFNDAKILARCGLRLPRANKRDFLLALAATFDYLGQPDSSLIIYDSLRRLYPNDHQPFYEKGILYFRKKNYDSATSYFQQSLIINPGYYKSHYMLGLIYALEGRLTEGLIAVQASLLMTSNADQAKKSILIINNIITGNDESVKLHSEKNEKYSHPLFDEIDELLLSKLALHDEYKLQMSLNDNIFRQSQLVMEKLKYDPTDGNFVMQFYVPVLTQLFRDNQFEPFILELYSGFGFDNVDNLAKKRSKDVDEVKGIVFPYFNKIQATRELYYKARANAKEMYHYNTEDNRIIVGEIKTIGKERVVTGSATFLRSDHTLRASGNFNATGKKDGWWFYYFTTGKLMSKTFYRNDEERDTSFDYYGNGNLKQMVTRDLSGNKKSEFNYDYGGWLSSVKTTMPDKMVEDKSYYANGQLETRLIYEGDNVNDGNYPIYYDNGKIKKQVTITGGKIDGLLKMYFRNGQLSGTINYAKGKEDGEYEDYYSNGKLKEKGTFASGKKSGPYEIYTIAGRLEEKGTYDDGAKDELTRYNDSGAVFAYFKLKKNVPVKLRFLDEDKHVLYEKEDKSGIYDYPIYNDRGNKSVDMKISEKGNRNGQLTFYYYTGGRSEVGNYTEGDEEGDNKMYFKDGKLRTEQSYSKDKKDGYYKNYYYNGMVNTEGWYKEGKKQGLWKYYQVNGKLKNEINYLNDELNGNYVYYNVNGELEDKFLYEFGMPVGYVCYDTAGNLTDSNYFGTHNGEFAFTHFKSQPKLADARFTIKNGTYDGPTTWTYVNGNLSKREFFRTGNLDSLSTSYFPDGRISSKGMYSNGQKTGKWEYFDEAGSLVREEEYNGLGDMEGKVNLYTSGVRHIQYNYVDGNKTGEQNYYGENDRVAFKLIYEDDNLNGYTYEGKDGKMLPVIKLKNGSGKMVAYYSNGKVSGEALFNQNMVEGPLKVYYSSGQIAEERNYKYFDLHGPFKRYNPDGKLVYEVNYIDDEANGHERTYDKDGKLVIDANYFCGHKHGPVVIVDPAGNNTTTYNYHYGLLTSISK